MVLTADDPTVKAVAAILAFPGWLALSLAIPADMGAFLLATLNGSGLGTITPLVTCPCVRANVMHGPCC